MKKTIVILLSALTLLSCKFNRTSTPKNNIEEKKSNIKDLPQINEKVEKVMSPVLGIDVSHFQGDVNWVDVKKSGVQFCYAKATQGKHFKDPKFKENQSNAKRAGIKHGAYHFYMASDDPKLQAISFLSIIQDVDKGNLLPMLDLEQGGVKGKLNVAQFQKNVITWLVMVEDKLGVKPIIYTNNPFSKTYLQNPIFAEYKLWLAEYGVKKPRIPSPWKDWIIWQRSEKGYVSGVNGNTDHDILNSKYQLKDIIF